MILGLTQETTFTFPCCSLIWFNCFLLTGTYDVQSSGSFVVEM